MSNTGGAAAANSGPPSGLSVGGTNSGGGSTNSSSSSGAAAAAAPGTGTTASSRHTFEHCAKLALELDEGKWNGEFGLSCNFWRHLAADTCNATSYLVCIIAKMLAADTIYCQAHSLKDAPLVLAVNAVLADMHKGAQARRRTSMPPLGSMELRPTDEHDLILLLQAIHFVVVFVEYDCTSEPLRMAFSEWDAFRGSGENGFEGRLMRSLCSRSPRDMLTAANAVRACLGDPVSSDSDFALSELCRSCVEDKSFSLIKELMQLLDVESTLERLKEYLPAIAVLIRMVVLQTPSLHPALLSNLHDAVMPFVAWPSPYGNLCLRTLDSVTRELLCPGHTSEPLFDHVFVVNDTTQGFEVAVGSFVSIAAVLKRSLEHRSTTPLCRHQKIFHIFSRFSKFFGPNFDETGFSDALQTCSNEEIDEYMKELADICATATEMDEAQAVSFSQERLSKLYMALGSRETLPHAAKETCCELCTQRGPVFHCFDLNVNQTEYGDAAAIKNDLSAGVQVINTILLQFLEVRQDGPLKLVVLGSDQLLSRVLASLMCVNDDTPSLTCNLRIQLYFASITDNPALLVDARNDSDSVFTPRSLLGRSVTPDVTENDSVVFVRDSSLPVFGDRNSDNSLLDRDDASGGGGGGASTLSRRESASNLDFSQQLSSTQSLAQLPPSPLSSQAQQSQQQQQQQTPQQQQQLLQQALFSSNGSGALLFDADGMVDGTEMADGETDAVFRFLCARDPIYKLELRNAMARCLCSVLSAQVLLTRDSSPTRAGAGPAGPAASFGFLNEIRQKGPNPPQAVRQAYNTPSPADLLHNIITRFVRDAQESINVPLLRVELTFGKMQAGVLMPSTIATSLYFRGVLMQDPALAKARKGKPKSDIEVCITFEQYSGAVKTVSCHLTEIDSLVIKSAMWQQGPVGGIGVLEIKQNNSFTRMPFVECLVSLTKGPSFGLFLDGLRYRNLISFRVLPITRVEKIDSDKALFRKTRLACDFMTYVPIVAPLS